MTNRAGHKQWDYIIIGAGSAGCAAAHQLVQAGRRVLVIEAGGSDRSPWLKVPAGVWRISPSHDWGYRAQPDPTRNGIVEAWHRGRVLGGTSSINGMIYVRGAPGDFDRWSQHVGHRGGWSAAEVMPIFRDFESSDQHGPVRGRHGPLHIRTVKHPHAVTTAFIQSASTAGYSYNADYNGVNQEGVGYLQFTQRRGLRWSSADAFLKPLRNRQNLQLRLGATVEKIEIANGRVQAVVFQHRGTRYREVAGDVVLSAGAVNTPKLLMLSGIGDAEELRRHNIDVVIDRPAVGNNLKEHALIPLSYRTRIPTNNLTQGIFQKLAIAAKYAWLREGPIAAAYEATAFLKTVTSLAVPDIQVFFAPIGWGQMNGSWKLSPFPALKICVLRSHPVSSGQIRLASCDPLAPPVIDCRLLNSEADMDTLVRGVKIVRSIMQSQPIASLVEAETAPGEAISSDEGLREYLRNHTTTSCHPMGTCRMGVDDDAVVGPDLRVRGVENLWIADTSIMPDAISANLNAPSMMIGAKLGRQLVGAGSSLQ